jgi:hypothetical protein
LLIVVWKGIAENEDTFLAGVSMEVDEDLEVFVLLGVLGHCNFGSPDSWLVFAVWLLIKPIKVLSESVKSIEASSNSIRV